MTYCMLTDGYKYSGVSDGRSRCNNNAPGEKWKIPEVASIVAALINTIT